MCKLGEADKPPQHAKHLIDQAYKALEKYWRNNSDEDYRDWWEKFLNSVKLLTITDQYAHLTTGIYVDDDPIRYTLFKDEIPFIWRPVSPGLFKNFFSQLHLRYVSDPQWVDVKAEADEEVDKKLSETIRAELIENRRFIRSILVHKYPESSDEFLPLLDLFDENSSFKVSWVERVQVILHLINPPTQVEPVEEVCNAYYDFDIHILYINANFDIDANFDKKSIGIAVAAMFGRFEEGIRSELMQLFQLETFEAKKDLLEKYLRIPLSKEESLVILNRQTESTQPKNDAPDGESEESSEQNTQTETVSQEEEITEEVSSENDSEQSEETAEFSGNPNEKTEEESDEQDDIIDTSDDNQTEESGKSPDNEGEGGRYDGAENNDNIGNSDNVSNAEDGEYTEDGNEEAGDNKEPNTDNSQNESKQTSNFHESNSSVVFFINVLLQKMARRHILERKETSVRVMKADRHLLSG